MLLLTVPVAGWFLEYQQTQLRRAAGALLDQLAGELKLVKLPRAEPQPKNVSEAPSMPMRSEGSSLIPASR